MPAKSGKQRRAAAMALSAKRRGKVKSLRGAPRQMAKMSVTQLRHFAKKKKRKR